MYNQIQYEWSDIIITYRIFFLLKTMKTIYTPIYVYIFTSDLYLYVQHLNTNKYIDIRDQTRE